MNDKVKIFLDDYRIPIDCVKYMHHQLGKENFLYLENWFVAKSYPDFVAMVCRFKGQITHVSFDHDLVDGHYHQSLQEGIINYDGDNFKDDHNKTGYHAAKYLIELYEFDKIELPKIFIHSMNPLGAENIKKLFADE